MQDHFIWAHSIHWLKSSTRRRARSAFLGLVLAGPLSVGPVVPRAFAQSADVPVERTQDDAPAEEEAEAAPATSSETLVARPVESGTTLDEQPPSAAEPPPPSAAARVTPAPPQVEALIAPEEEMAKNTIYIEFLGPGGLYSLNYERSISQANLRIGASYISIEGISLAVFPVGANYTGIGGRDHHLELGGTVSIAILSGDVYGFQGSAVGAAIVPILGYRFQPYLGGFNFRLGASPFIGPGGVLPWGYLSLGATF